MLSFHQILPKCERDHERNRWEYVSSIVLSFLKSWRNRFYKILVVVRFASRFKRRDNNNKTVQLHLIQASIRKTSGGCKKFFTTFYAFFSLKTRVRPAVLGDAMVKSELEKLSGCTISGRSTFLPIHISIRRFCSSIASGDFAVLLHPLWH